MLMLQLTLMISVILSVAFFTLLERKFLAYIQERKGPNKIIFMGIPQPLADALKLLTKEWLKPSLSNKILFSLSPMMLLIISLMLWFIMPIKGSFMFFKLMLLIFIMIMSLSIYPLFLTGWMSNSKYSVLGALRSIAQTISYEIVMALVLLTPIIMMMSFNITMIEKYQYNLWLLMVLPMMFMIWFITILAETNRTPFDLVEGESELVSGFNVEFSSVGFTLIFLAEYSSILLMSMMTSFMFLSGMNFIFMKLNIMLMIKVLLMSLIFIWMRGSLPRMRYNNLMKLTWVLMLPLTLSILAMMMCILIN